jgi:hypothetical protein
MSQEAYIANNVAQLTRLAFLSVWKYACYPLSYLPQSQDKEKIMANEITVLFFFFVCLLALSFFYSFRLSFY